MLIQIINFYQRYISPSLGNRCRFYPSCSEYAKEALQELPFRKACFKIIYRLLRCQPFAKSGYDPVIYYNKKKKNHEMNVKVKSEE